MQRSVLMDEKKESSRGNSRELLLLGLVGGDHGEIDQVLITVVDEAVGMTLGAIMAAVFRQCLAGVVIQDFAATGEDVEHLAVSFVGVEADGSAGDQLSPNDFAESICVGAHGDAFFTAAHLGNDGFLNGFEIDQHKVPPCLFSWHKCIPFAGEINPLSVQFMGDIVG